MKKRLHFLLSDISNKQQKDNRDVPHIEIIVKIPYKKAIFNKVKSILNKEKYNVIPKLNRDLCSIVKKEKVVSKLNRTGAVYKIKFKETGCDEVYVGDSKRALYFRINEHEGDVVI